MRKAASPARRAVRVYLAEQGQTQGWLARRLRTSESVVSGVLAGRRRASPEFLAKVREFTGIDLTEFPHESAGILLLTGVAATKHESEPELVST